MKIGVITYDHPHRKTQDLIYRLMLMGYDDIELIILPWIERKEHKPFYQHRPIDAVQITIEQLCIRLGKVSHWGKLTEIFAENRYDKILIGGAGILPQEVLKYNIINSHPGYLPKVRGLDALKWAILNDQEIGVTTYIIGEQADTGIMIDRQTLPLNFTDTFHSIAQRLYELEIRMLAETIIKEPNGQQFAAQYEYPVTGRMGHYDEIRMIGRLNKMLSEL
jgi:methionyl-tRNA formyltransferase